MTTINIDSDVLIEIVNVACKEAKLIEKPLSNLFIYRSQQKLMNKIKNEN